MSEEQEILDLLNQLDAKLAKHPTSKGQSIIKEETVYWIFSDSTYQCLQCNRIYYGKLYHASLNLPERQHVSWCPKCLDNEIFWLHYNFTVEKVDEP